jgi:hypothetical protein
MEYDATSNTLVQIHWGCGDNPLTALEKYNADAMAFIVVSHVATCAQVQQLVNDKFKEHFGSERDPNLLPGPICGRVSRTRTGSCAASLTASRSLTSSPAARVNSRRSTSTFRSRQRGRSLL